MATTEYRPSRSSTYGLEKTRPIRTAVDDRKGLTGHQQASQARAKRAFGAPVGNAPSASRTIGEIVQLYFAFNAPDTADGLANSTFRTYSWSAKRHLLGHEGMVKGRRLAPAKYAVRLAMEPAELFNHAAAPRALREAMKHERVGQSARAHAWRVLSAVLSWAAQSDLVPEIQTNGCLLANEKVVRRKDGCMPHDGQPSPQVGASVSDASRQLGS